MVATASDLRLKFFDYLFDNEEGIFVVAYAKLDVGQHKIWKHKWFDWPKDRDKISTFIEKMQPNWNMYFGVNLFSSNQRKKEFVLPGNRVHCDLDGTDPSKVEPIPQVVIETSPGRFQAIWRLDKIIDTEIAEDYSRRIAYKYKGGDYDADPCWDCNRVLRVPFSHNFKYETTGIIPEVKLHAALETLLPVEVFEELERITLTPEEEDWEQDLPDPTNLPDAQQVIYKYLVPLKKTPFVEYYGEEPHIEDDWSRRLWRLINICFECGMETEEVFAIALTSKCNKYKRDNRPVRYLWRDVKKAEVSQQNFNVLFGNIVPLAMPSLVEKSQLEGETLVDEYRKWAQLSTDAPVAYHDLSCFMLLSTLVSQGLKLETSYGKMVPNIWGLILGDSASRKTTAMRMATGFIGDIDKNLILATDGSAEGLMTGLSERPNMVSVYYKDEVAGFIDSINRKDYLAGMPETMTQLYDVPQFLTRRLRKEVINITNPVFIFFGGGIQDKFFSLITEEFILSGFLPRFLIVCGTADMEKLRPTGPATPATDTGRGKLLSKFSDLYENYARLEDVQILGQTTQLPAVIEAFLTQEAWEVYGRLEMDMVKIAHESSVATTAVPTFERLSRSILKMSLLLAATRQEPEQNTIQVNDQDILHSAWYIQDWGRYSVDLIINSGRTKHQRTIDKILGFIGRNPGVNRGAVMQTFRLMKREMDEIQGTLADRGQLRVLREGKGVVYYAQD